MGESLWKAGAGSLHRLSSPVLHLNGSRFAAGRSKFSDQSPELPEPTAKIYVKVRFGQSTDVLLVQLDTGAAWSVLAPDIAEEAGLSPEDGDPTKLQTRFGTLTGSLVRVPLTLIADDGESLQTNGTFFVSADWPKKLSFLGYSGLMDSIRFAVDPWQNDFYFGPAVPAP